MPPQSLGQTDRQTDRQTLSGSSSTEVEKISLASEVESSAMSTLLFSTSVELEPENVCLSVCPKLWGGISGQFKLL